MTHPENDPRGGHWDDYGHWHPGPQPPAQQPYAQFPPPGPGYPPESHEDHTHLSFTEEPEPPQRFVIGPGYQQQPPPPRPVLPGPDPMQHSSAYHPLSAYHPNNTPVSASHPVSQPSAPMPQHHPSASYPPQQPWPPQDSWGAPGAQDSWGAPGAQDSWGAPGAQRTGATAASEGRRRNNTRAIAAVVIGVVAVAGILLIGISQFQRGSSSTAGNATANELTRPAPPGWSKRFVWSTDIPATAAVAVVDNRVAYIGEGGTLHVLNADTGAQQLSSVPNTVTAEARPFLAVTQGVPVAGIVDDSTLLLWRLDTPGSEPQTITLAPKAKVYAQGGGLLVTTGSEFWVVNGAGGLAPVTLGPEEVALAATPDGMLLSAPPRGGWVIHAPGGGTAPREVRPERTPEGTVGDMQVAWSSRGVIAAWGDTAEVDRRTVGLFDADTGKLLAGEMLPTEVVKAGLPLTVSPKREFASAGPLLARLSDGKTEVVERWSTIMSDAKNLYGTRDGRKIFWNGDLPPLEMDQKAVVPWGMSDARYAIVMDPVAGSRIRLGALAEG